MRLKNFKTLALWQAQPR